MNAFKNWFPVALAAVLVAGVMLAPHVAQQVAYAVERGKNEAARADLAELSKGDTLSGVFRAVAEVVKPAVVEVRIVKQMEQPGIEDFFGEDFPIPQPFRGRLPQRRSVPVRGLGSGVIVDAKNGYVLTNVHVVGDADKVEVVLADGRKFEAQWVRTDPETDVAVVKIEPDRLTDAPLGDSDQCDVGDWVLAIGAPKGLPQTVTAGIISAKGRHNAGLSTVYQNMLQTDAAINKGNSGGPLVNMRGEVVGLNNAIATSSPFSGNVGIGFAIPSNMARDVMEQLVGGGKVVRGFLGILPQDVDERIAKSLKLQTTKGAMIAQVVPGGPADKAGLKVEDVVVSINGKEIADANELRNVVAAVQPGKTISVELYRNGEKMTVEVALVERTPELAGAGPQAQSQQEVPARKFGLTVATMTDELASRYGYEKPREGVVITAVDPESDAAEQGLREGMLVTHVEGKAAETVDQFAQAIAGAKGGLRLRVVGPGGGARIVFIEPGKP